MNPLQQKLWREMIETIDKYFSGSISYVVTVKNLEGLLDAGDFRDQKLIKKWYDHWQPLEVTNAIKGNSAKLNEVKDHAEAMRKFLADELAELA